MRLILSTILLFFGTISFAQFPKSLAAIQLGYSNVNNTNNMPTTGPFTTVNFSGFSASLDVHEAESYFSFKMSPIYSDMVTFNVLNNDKREQFGLLTGGKLGRFRSGLNFVASKDFRLGFGVSLGSYQLDATTADLGFHAAAGPMLHSAFAFNDWSFIHLSASYDFTYWHALPVSIPATEGLPHEERVAYADSLASQPNPHWINANITLFTKSRFNLGVEYWHMISRESSFTKANRLMVNISFSLFQFNDWNTDYKEFTKPDDVLIID